MPENGRRMLLFGLIALSVTCYVAADEGDDFSNNLFSDLSPLLALFGERVTMQFMSESMGWADNIILAMAPLGIITIIVSAIRVGGPSWLKAVVGRARENLAVAEAELMSSTSDEVCELWNGREVVRCMGSTPVAEFICLLPNDKLTGRPPSIWSVLQRHGERLRHAIGAQDSASIKTSICKRRPLEIEVLTLTQALKEKRYFEEIGVIGDDGHDPRSSSHRPVSDEEAPSTQQHIGIDTSRKITMIRNDDTGSPNISLNINGRSHLIELVIVATIGSILQLGVLVYAGFTSYRPSLGLKKDDKPMPTYAFPCTAVGTSMLVLGIAVCAHVVESSTRERRFRPSDGRKLRLVWLQKQKTVSDQIFESCAIYDRYDQDYVMTSRRCMRRVFEQSFWEWLRVFVKLFRERITSSIEDIRAARLHVLSLWQYARRRHTIGRGRKRTDEDADAQKMQYAILMLKTVIGTAITLCGFFLQFIGLRGMHWSVSIAQLGAVLIMVFLKAWVRRELANPPEAQAVEAGFELDWLANTSFDIKHKHWGGQLDPKSRNETWRIVIDAETQLKFGANRSTAPVMGEADRLTKGLPPSPNPFPLAPLGPDTAACAVRAQYKGRLPQAVLNARQNLGVLAEWPGFADAESKCLTRAMEVTMDALYDSYPDGASLEWHHIAHYDGSNQPVVLNMHRNAGTWRADLGQMNAALSLWQYSLEIKSEEKNDDLPIKLRLLPPGGKVQEPVDRPYIQSSSLFSPRLISDLQCWAPRGTFIMSGVPDMAQKYRFACRAATRAEARCDDEVLDDSQFDAHYNIQNTCVEFYTSVKFSFAQAMFSSFMKAVAKQLENPICGGLDEVRPDDAKDLRSWGQLTIHNSKLSQMVQDIHSTGIGSLSLVWASVITPLSEYQRLPGADASIEWARKHAETFAQRQDWEEVGIALLWLCQLATGPSGTRAICILLDHLRRMELMLEFYESQKCHKSEVEFEALSASKDKVKRRLQTTPLDAKHVEMIFKLFDQRKCFQERGGGLMPVFMTIREEGTRLEAAAEADCTGARSYDESFKVTEWHSNAMECDRYDNHRRKWLRLAFDLKDDHGHFVNARDILDRTPAHYAAVNGGIQIERLKSAGADLNCRDLLKWTPLHYACWCGNLSQTKSLIKGGAELNAQTREGAAPIHNAAIQGHLSVVRLLVEADARVDIPDGLGNTPSLLASYKGHKDVVRLLLLHERRIARDFLERTALHQAALAGNDDLVGMLAEDLSVAKDSIDSSGQTPLILAVRWGRLVCVKTLLEHNVAVDFADGRGKTALHWAAEVGHNDILQYLLDNSAYRNSTDRSSQTPLILAVRQEQDVCVQTLLREGADVKIEDDAGRTALHWAAEAGFEHLVKHLLEKKASKEARDCLGQTPLHLAAQSGRHDVVKTLLEENADVNSQASPWRKMTPLMLAACNNQVKVLELLVDYGANIKLKDSIGQSALHLAAKWDAVDAIEKLVELGADLESRRDDDLTPLLVAIEYGERKTVRLLSQLGSNIKAAGSDGLSAFDKAVERGDADITSLLRKQPGPSLNRHNSMGDIRNRESEQTKSREVSTVTQNGVSRLATFLTDL